MKKIAIITARSGSKGLPNKNVLLANGKPLIAYSIEAAIEADCFEKIIISTDSQEYIDLLSHYPVEFIKRAEHLATDKASSFVVIEDVLNQYQHIDFDYFVLLQPTSPLRTSTHILQANQQFEAEFKQFDFLVSVCKSDKSTILIKEIDADNNLKNFDTDFSNYIRQSIYDEYYPNGAIFIAKPQSYLIQKHFFGAKTLAYKMDKTSSLDIDYSEDFEYFYFLLQQKDKENILLNNIKQRIEVKAPCFHQQADITLIGHSILDQWNIHRLGEKSINNLGISGISSKEYLELIIKPQLISHVSNIVFIMLGVNDIARLNWSVQETTKAIQDIIDTLKELNPHSVIYFLEITPTALRIDRRNEDILKLNNVLKTELKNITWIDLYQLFLDKYGKLNMDYTHDGLHLNHTGYQLLTTILEKELAK